MLRNTKAGEQLEGVLKGLPFHIMYEESKQSGVLNLNSTLRAKLCGKAKPYPSLVGATCDVVFSIDGESIWMEVKLMQTHNGGNKNSWRFEDRNISFSKYLFQSAVQDVQHRLPTLDGHDGADRIGFLMVTYDSPRHPIAGPISEFERVTDLLTWAKDVLVEQQDPRDRAKAENARISVVYWERPTRR